MSIEDQTPLDAAAPETGEPAKVMERETPNPEPARAHLVKALTSMVRCAKQHWKEVFDAALRDAKFCEGNQWREETKSGLFNDGLDDRYVANITLRHVQQRVASTYAKNPRMVARRRQQLLATVWDGTMQSLAQAQETVQRNAVTQQALGAFAATGQLPMAPGPDGMPQPAPMPPPPPAPEELMEAQLIIEDAKNVKMQNQQLDRMAQTLKLLWEYEIDEQQQPFKTMLKHSVRTAETMGFAWIKLGFQRVMGRSPDVDSHIADVQTRLETIERISADIADNELQQDAPEAERLRLLLADLERDAEVVVREGLQFSYPKPTAIIPDPKTSFLRTFLGADWVAEEYLLTPNEIKETYKVDIRSSFESYSRESISEDYEVARAKWEKGGDLDSGETNKDCALVWEIYNKKDGLVYVVCDGYPDFLREPAQPEVYLSRFYPWFLVAFYETANRTYPLSSVSLIRSMQLEINRSRQGLREHRMANRPKTAYADGTLDEEDKEALANHPVNALIAIKGLQPGQDIKQLLQPFSGPPIDPNLYTSESIFQDLLRVSGDQEANLGGTAGNTATETNVAQASLSTSIGSATDDLDVTLTEIARAASEILLLNVSEQTAKEVVGPGAVWPQLSKAEVAKSLWLEVVAGSSGRPNQARELQNFERLAPILLQTPGVKPDFMAREAIKRLDDNLDPMDAIVEGLPSIQQMNGGGGMSPMAAGPGAGDPRAQGPQGSNNAPSAPPPNPSAPTPKPPPQQPGAP